MENARFFLFCTGEIPVEQPMKGSKSVGAILLFSARDRAQKEGGKWGIDFAAQAKRSAWASKPRGIKGEENKT